MFLRGGTPAGRHRAGECRRQSSVPGGPCKLFGLLAGDLFGDQLHHAQRRPKAVGLGAVGAVACVWHILAGKLQDGGALFGGVGQLPHLPEHDHAAEIGGVLLRHHPVLVNDAEGRLGAAAHRIQLVA